MVASVIVTPSVTGIGTRSHYRDLVRCAESVSLTTGK